ncbi:hypothetical protein MesoLjLc_18280 [Mesorhizobium sp. L-8-10]|nr:hypothetical protein MesoLjLc_18280 [Mesorhizobium sp. L-8-10]
MGIVHGGWLLTFADYCLFVTARTASDPDEIVTISMNSEFVGMTFPSQRVEAKAEIVRAGRSLIFVRGLVSGLKGPILNFSGVAKVVPNKKISP